MFKIYSIIKDSCHKKRSVNLYFKQKNKALSQTGTKDKYNYDNRNANHYGYYANEI